MTKEAHKKEKHYYIYRFLNQENEVLYVGKTYNQLKERIRVHIKIGKFTEKQLKEIDKIQYIEISNPFDWHILEIFYINYFKAKYNKEFQCQEELFKLINTKEIIGKYYWKDVITKKEFLEILENSKSKYRRNGVLKVQKETQLTQKEFNNLCTELQNSKKTSDKINWLLINLLAYTSIGLKNILMLKWKDIENEINKEHVPVELINFYKETINPFCNFKENDYIISSQKDGFFPLSSASKKIKIFINHFYKGTYNSRSFKNIRENYFAQTLKKEDIIWLNTKKERK